MLLHAKDFTLRVAINPAPVLTSRWENVSKTVTGEQNANDKYKYSSSNTSISSSTVLYAHEAQRICKVSNYRGAAAVGQEEEAAVFMREVSLDERRGNEW
ncbi:hypothetical protein AOLI_G00251060 [Acnodon oligacanthus]